MDDPELVVQGMLRVVDLVKPACGACEQNDPRLGLEGVPEPPPRVRVGHVPEHHVQVLDHQHEPLALAIGKILQSAEAAIAEHSVVTNRAELLTGSAQVGVSVPAGRLDRQSRKRFQPELSRGGDLVALLREDDGKEVRLQYRIPAHLGRNAEEETRLPAAARSNHDLMGVRASRALTQHLDDRFELVCPHAERRHQLVVG